MVQHAIPELRRILFTQKHDRLPRPCAEVVRFFDSMDEQVVQVEIGIVETDELVRGVG